MQFFVTSILLGLASAPLAMSALVTFYRAADCAGPTSGDADVGTGQCWNLGTGVKSVRYSNVPEEIDLFVDGSIHDSCTNGPWTIGFGGSGCVNAPDG